MRYIEIVADVAATDAEPVADVLRELTDAGVWIETPFEQPDLESDANVIVDGGVSVHAFMPADSDRGGIVLEARRRIDTLGISAEIEARVIADEDWAEAWKEHFHVERYGERIVVVPSWREYEARPADAVLTLDPGMAFGTGQHETTRMCLEALERAVSPGARVLDVGCGSGILAIAAAKLGAGDVYAVDVDPICVKVASANADANRVVLRSAIGSLGDTWPFEQPAAGFDVVVANIMASAIVSMVPHLAGALAPRGRLIASGIIAARQAEVVSAFEGVGLRIEEVRCMGEWRCIESVQA